MSDLNARLESYKARAVPKEYFKQLRKLISSGTIFKTFLSLCELPRRNHIIALLKDGPEILGWSTLEQEGHSYTFMVYIRLKYRRLGYGSRLYRYCKKIMKLTDKQIVVYKTSSTATKFYNKLRNEA